MKLHFSQHCLFPFAETEFSTKNTYPVFVLHKQHFRPKALFFRFVILIILKKKNQCQSCRCVHRDPIYYGIIPIGHWWGNDHYDKIGMGEGYKRIMTDFLKEMQQFCKQ